LRICAPKEGRCACFVGTVFVDIHVSQLHFSLSWTAGGSKAVAYSGTKPFVCGLLTVYRGIKLHYNNALAGSIIRRKYSARQGAGVTTPSMQLTQEDGEYTHSLC
jgi:hypothetical protein